MKSTDEINKYIHTEIMGKCWHLLRGGENPCVNCGMTLNYGLGLYNEDYCSDESPRRLLNEVVAAINNDELVTMEIQRQVGYATFEIRATAEQIATACVEAHKALKEAR